MKITVAKVKKELIKNHGYNPVFFTPNAYKAIIDVVIRDTLRVVNKTLKEQKGISIK